MSANGHGRSTRHSSLSSWWRNRSRRHHERQILDHEELEARAKLPHLPDVPLRQKMITAGACITFVWTTWALAGQTVFTLTCSTAFSILTFLLLFIPNGEYGNTSEIRQNIRNLLHFPLFWIGLAMMAYITIQGLNPAVTVIMAGKGWKLHLLRDVIAWLPTGVDAPFAGPGGMNAWRQMCIFGSAWLMLSTLWCGLSSRRMWKILFCVFVANAIALAVLGLYRISTGTTYLFDYRGFYFFSSFSYKNHAGEFFVLSISVCVALGLHLWRSTVERGSRGGAHLLLIICGLILLGTVFATKSVAAVFLGVIWLPLSVALIIFSKLLNRASIVAVGIFVIMLVGLAGTWWMTVNTDSFFYRVDAKTRVGELPTVENTIGTEIEGTKEAEKPPVEKFSLDKGERAELRKLSWKMFHQNHHTEIFGWGAGGYRWIAPTFQRTMPEFLRTTRDGKVRLRSRTEYAHCDPLHMIVEWGSVGAGIFFAGIAWFIFFAIRKFRYWRVSSAALFAGLVLFCAHACVDFVSYNPALILCVAIVTAGFRANLKHEIST